MDQEGIEPSSWYQVVNYSTVVPRVSGETLRVCPRSHTADPYLSEVGIDAFTVVPVCLAVVFFDVFFPGGDFCFAYFLAVGFLEVLELFLECFAGFCECSVGYFVVDCVW